MFGYEQDFYVKMNCRFNFLINILVLLLWRSQHSFGFAVNVSVNDTTCVGNNIKLSCAIDPFTAPTSATWNRNGSALTTCTSGGICTTESLTINGINYTFSGSSAGQHVSFQIQLVEDNIVWNCDHNANSYPYTFKVLDKCPERDKDAILNTAKSPSNAVLIGSTVGSGIGVLLVIFIIFFIVVHCRESKIRADALAKKKFNRTYDMESDTPYTIVNTMYDNRAYQRPMLAAYPYNWGSDPYDHDPYAPYMAQKQIRAFGSDEDHYQPRRTPWETPRMDHEWHASEQT